ncbi:MAG: ribosomal protein S18-alanine N-acetyltransferase [Frankia sp.]
MTATSRGARRGPSGRGQTVTLHPLRWWDIASLGHLERGVFGEDAWSDELFWSELAQGDTRLYLVARDEGEAIVGYAGLAIHGEEAYVQTIAVVARWRGSGLGTRLLVAILRYARERGARACGLEVRTDNDAARSVYQRFGFVDIGIRRGYYQPSGADAYVMVLRGLHRSDYGRHLDRLETAVSR